MLSALFLVLGSVASGGASGDASGAASAVHPMDGPDADVRIRISDERVRVVCAFNLAFLDAILDVPREVPGAIAGPEKEVARHALLAYLADANEVAIDGVAVRPVDRGFETAPAPPELVPLFPGFGARALAKVQLTLDYPAQSPPRRVRFTWGPFPPNPVLAMPGGAPPIEINAQLHAEGRDTIVVLTAGAPAYEWEATGADPEERFLAVPPVAGAAGRALPVLSLALVAAGLAVVASAFRRGAGAGLRRRAALIGVLLFAAAVPARGVVRIELERAAELAAPDARAIFGPLHANIYRAFDYDDESDIYDALARSVDGPLLEELYDQLYRSLLNQEAGGARSMVRGVRLEELELVARDDADPRPGFDVEALWQVDGAVFHWGHAHTRTNEYRARYGVRAAEGGWRIASSRVLAERRVDAAPLAPPFPDGPDALLFLDPPLPDGIEDL